MIAKIAGLPACFQSKSSSERLQSAATELDSEPNKGNKDIPLKNNRGALLRK
jgi:hypothetical protein